VAGLAAQSNVNSTFPRVLVLSATSIGVHSNSAITLRNLFAEWDPNALAQIYLETREPDSGICGQAFYQDPGNFRLGGMAKLVKSRIETQGKASTLRTVTQPTGLGRGGRLRRTLEAWADLLPFQLSEDLLASIRVFQPQVLYTTLGSIRMITLANVLSNRLKIPIVPHFMDDWPRTYHAKEFLAIVPRIVLRHKLKRLFRQASMGMAISPYMVDAYRDRYGIPFEAFMNCAECQNEFHDTSEGEGSLRMAFVGGLHLGRMAMLKDFEAALSILRDEGCMVDFRVFVLPRDMPSVRDQFGETSPVKICAELPFGEMPAVLADSDVLVHLESFDSNSRQYTLLSLSTKIPLYFATGRPILVYGAPEVGTSRYIRDTGTGLLVGNQSIVELSDAIRKMATDPGCRKAMGKRARAAALTSHDASTERRRFAQTLWRGTGYQPS
jgi:glycosyltransferase involved in cell wall biosynthesis